MTEIIGELMTSEEAEKVVEEEKAILQRVSGSAKYTIPTLMIIEMTLARKCMKRN